MRAVAAGTLLLLCLPDWEALRWRAELAALPDYDYQAEAETLLADERFSEALLVVDAGLEALPEQAGLAALRTRIVAERDDWARRLREAGHGAWSGQGDSLEALGGAVVADLFVFGDVRDLVIQSSRAIQGQEVDSVIVALSAAGLVLTVAPELDLGAALLKFARRSGAISARFVRSLKGLARTATEERRVEPLLEVVGDASRLGRRAGPAPALRILKQVDDPAELKLVADYAARPSHAFALWLSGREGVQMLKSGEDGALWLAKAARKGRSGLQLLAGHRRALTRAHPFVGLLKGAYKGNVPDLVAEALARWGAILWGLFAAWFGFESLLCAGRCRRVLRR